MHNTVAQLDLPAPALPLYALDKATRARQKSQLPLCIWLTGLSGSGKSTLANLLESRLFAAGRHTYLLDGDAFRRGLSRDLGFSEDDRNENIRRVAEVARLLTDAGLIVIVALISPYRAGRNAARALFAHDEFLEIFVDAPLAECERRDPKGLYARARRGLLPHFTGIDSQYEPPLLPEARLDTVAFTPDECVDQLLRVLDKQTLNRQSLASIPDPQSLGPQILGSECQAPRLLDPVA